MVFLVLDVYYTRHMKVTVIGTGFVGVVSAAVYASLGHQVVGLDIDENKITSLRQGQVPFYEPGLQELLLDQQKNSQLTFTTSYEEAIKGAEIIIIAVGTPSAADETADLRYVLASARSLAEHLAENAIVVIKSTVPPGTLEKVTAAIKEITQVKFYGASLPEFLREGSAVHDTLHPDRLVIGADDDFVFDKLEELHADLQAPVVRCSVPSAQMAKYTANAYLATRITFINEIANLCEKNGADIEEIIQAIGYDKRIGQHYWYPGLGYGGSCFPKDVKELAAYSRSVGEDGNLLNRINEINKERIFRLLDKFAAKIGGFEGKTVALLGLAFKPNTDDMREAPSTKIIPFLSKHGATVKSFDPMAKYQNLEGDAHQQMATLPEACEGADVIMAVVEWPEIIGFDFAAVRNDQAQFFIDARNQFNKNQVEAWGYQYLGIGKK
jgi:UDPglucose 6-dehydrogenase